MIGSVNLQYEILKRKATLFGQLCRLNPHFAVKRLFLYRVTSNYFFKDLRYGFILDIFRFLEDNNIEQILVEYINSGVFPSKYTWKRIVHEQLKSKAAFNTRLEIDEEGLGRFLNIHQETKPSLFWELSRRYPYMLTACRTVVRLIAASYNKYQPQTICLACGEVVSQFVDHCLLWCHANSRVRHKMWTGLWHKFGIDVYVRLASLPCCTLIDALFGNFDTVADIISTDRKDEFYCFVARYVHILKIHLCQSFNEGSFEVDSTV